jgi:DNA-binding IclR family transcriptional regulator
VTAPSIRVVERVAQILSLFDRPGSAISPQAAVDRLDLSRSTAYRYLRVLERTGVLARDREGDLVPGPLLHRAVAPPPPPPRPPWARQAR